MSRARTGLQLPPKLNLGCGSDVRDGYHNVDYVDGAGVDERVDLNDIPWPWPDDSFDFVLASHVLEHLSDLEGALSEIARVLYDGGRCEVRWPVGMNERADPDHKHTWVWDSPLYYCGERHWDTDVGLSVVDRDVTVHTHFNGGVGWAYDQLIDAYERRHGQGRWQFDLPVTSGEFRVVFER